MGTNRIPKNIFQSWYTKDVHPLIQHKINAIQHKNPGYAYHLYTDEEMDKFVNTYYPGEIADCYNKLNIIVAKVDFWRYLVLFKFGGVYLDFDSGLNICLDDLIKDEDECIISPEDNPYFFVQWAIICNAKHPILEKTIELIVRNIKENKYPNDIHSTTGPGVFTEAIETLYISAYKEKFKRDNADRTVFIRTIPCRIYKKDYGGAFSFKHDQSHLLYMNKKHWREEQRDKNLIQN